MRSAAIPKTPAPAPRAPAEDGIIEIHARPAPLWRRAIALAVDSAGVLAILVLYLWIATAVAGRPKVTQLAGLDGWVARAHAYQPVLGPGLLLAVILGVAYGAAFGFLWDGRTLGRRLAGICLVDSSGLAPAPARAILRAALGAVSLAIFFGGFFLALFDRRGQTLHDKLTRTFVVQRL